MGVSTTKLIITCACGDFIVQFNGRTSEGKIVFRVRSYYEDTCEEAIKI
jgi:hypothetical protein